MLVEPIQWGRGLLMKKILSLVLGGAALLSLSMTGTARAEPDYMYAATGFVGVGGEWLGFHGGCNIPACESDILTIVGGGDIVLPLNGYWNVQLGGAFFSHYQDVEADFGGAITRTQFQGGVIGFWRDPAMGVFGIEAGVFSPFGNESSGFQNSFKIGGVAEYFFSDIITVRGFGGALIPMESSRDGGLERTVIILSSFSTLFLFAHAPPSFLGLAPHIRELVMLLNFGFVSV